MEEFSMPQSILQIVSEKGFDGLREIMQRLFNEAMKMERENCLHASLYQRMDLRTDHANGFKPRTINIFFKQDLFNAGGQIFLLELNGGKIDGDRYCSSPHTPCRR